MTWYLVLLKIYFSWLGEWNEIISVNLGQSTQNKHQMSYIVALTCFSIYLKRKPKFVWRLNSSTVFTYDSLFLQFLVGNYSHWPNLGVLLDSSCISFYSCRGWWPQNSLPTTTHSDYYSYLHKTNNIHPLGWYLTISCCISNQRLGIYCSSSPFIHQMAALWPNLAHFRLPTIGSWAYSLLLTRDIAYDEYIWRMSLRSRRMRNIYEE